MLATQERTGLLKEGLLGGLARQSYVTGLLEELYRGPFV